MESAAPQANIENHMGGVDEFEILARRALTSIQIDRRRLMKGMTITEDHMHMSNVRSFLEKS